VRITHVPTGIVVSCQNERSQTQNKARAMQILAARLAERQRQERAAELVRLSGDKRDVAFGSQIRTYTLAPYRLVKDERTRYETGNVDAVLDGVPGGQHQNRRMHLVFPKLPAYLKAIHSRQHVRRER